MKRQLILFVLILTTFSNATGQTNFWTVAKHAQRPPAAPQYADVVFSIRWNRDRCNLSHAQQFHANRIEWSYIDDYDWVREVKRRGYFLGGALNTSLPDQLDPNGVPKTYTVGRLVSADGSPTGPVHLQAMGKQIACFNSPAYRQLFLDRALGLVRAGVDSIQVDGPSGGWGSVVNGRPVCYCLDCRKLAERREQNLNSRQTRSLLQRSGLKTLYSTAITETKKVNPALAWSKNVHKPMWFEALFDYEFAELDPADGIEPGAFLRLRERAGEPDRTQIYTLRSGDVRQNQATIALAYATGSHVSAPYDVYPADGYLTRQRYYGTAFHYAPLYAMVRYCAPLLSGYEDAYFQCAGVKDERWMTPPVRIEGQPENNFALFVRAQPSDPENGLTVHLLDRTSNKSCAGVSLRFRVNALKPAGEVFRGKSYAPLQYNASNHERVESRVLQIGRDKNRLDAIETSPEYRELVKQTELNCLQGDGFISINVPEFEVYAIVHIVARED